MVGLGAWYSYWRDPYHLMLTIPWPGFIAITSGLYLLGNALFALAYLAGGDAIVNAEPGSFQDAFFFSVQTLASIGYGAMHPANLYADILVTLEALTGLLGVAVLTGLAFARFSRPTARVMFSQVAVITQFEGIPTLMFRAANERRNQISEAQLRVYIMRDEVSAEGQRLRRFHQLRRLRDQTPSFLLTWTAMHPIEPDSPLYGSTEASLQRHNATLAISFSGLDETVAQTIHARYSYAAPEIRWNSRFKDIFQYTDEGDRYIDYSNFHQTIPIDLPAP